MILIIDTLRNDFEIEGRAQASMSVVATIIHHGHLIGRLSFIRPHAIIEQTRFILVNNYDNRF